MKRILFFVLLLISVGAFAQEQEQKRFIEVTGESTVEVTPDVAYFTILLVDVPKEGISVEKQEVEIAKLLKKYSIPSENLTIDKMSGLRQKVNFWGTKDVVNQKLYQLKVTNLAIVDNLLTDLAKEKVSQIQLSKVESSEIEKYKQEACQKAARNGKEKSLAFAKGMDVTIVAPLNLYEQSLSVSGENDDVRPRFMKMAMAEEASASMDTQQNFKNIIVRCSIRLRVEIK